MAPTTRTELRRLVLAFPTVAVPRPAIDSAAQLARFLRASLLGLFVEDPRLLAAASLPFVRQLDASLRAWRPFSHQRLLEDYAALAAALRRRLLESAQTSGVPAEFAVLRGELDAVVNSSTAPTDLVILFESVATWPLLEPRAAAGTVLVPLDARPNQGPVVALIGEADDIAIGVAKRIAASAELEIILVDAARQHSSAYWAGRGGVDQAQAGQGADRGAARLVAPRNVTASGGHFLQSGLPAASLVVLTRTTLGQLGERPIAIARSRPEPWLVLEDR
jgi:hypothetical protein